MRSRLFRNIVDSGDVVVAPDVTALVGKNESGKTALLSAIYRFHPVYGESFDLGDDYPRWRKSKDTKSGEIDKARPITCTFELSDEDLGAVSDAFGPNVATDRSYTRSVPYKDCRHTVLLQVDEAAALANVYEDTAASAVLGCPDWRVGYHCRPRPVTGRQSSPPGQDDPRAPLGQHEPGRRVADRGALFGQSRPPSTSGALMPPYSPATGATRAWRAA